MIRLRAAAAALAGVVVLGGCSVLTGKTSSEPKLTPHPPRSTSAAAADVNAQFTDEPVVSAVMDAAKLDFETVYTYDYRDLDKYRDAGLAVSTTPYSTSYRASFKGAPAQQLRARHQVQVPAADRVGIAGLSDHATAATAVVHGSLTTSSTAAANPAVKNITVALHLKLIGKTWRISTLTEGGPAKGAVPATSDLRAAVSSAQATLSRLFMLRRTGFDTDFAKVLAGTTGDLRDQLGQQKASLKKVLNNGKYDLSCTVYSFAVVAVDGDRAEFLITVDEFRTSAHGAKLGPYPHPLDAIVVNSGGTWLLSNATPVP